MSKVRRLLIAVSVLLCSFTYLQANEKQQPPPCIGFCETVNDNKINGAYTEAGILAEQMYYFSSYAAQFNQFEGLSEANFAPPFTYNNLNLVPFNFSVDPGFRIGLAKCLFFDHWEIAASIEAMYGRAKIDRNAPTLGHYSSLYFRDSFRWDKILATFKTDYYVLDAHLSRGSYIHKGLSFRPYGGIKNVWFYRFQTIWLTDISSQFENRYETIRQKTWAIGPMAGFDSTYCLAKYISLFLDGNSSVLMGGRYFRIGHWEELDSAMEANALETRAFNFNATTMFPTIRTCIGLQYFGPLYMKDMICKVRAGFDARYYSNQFPFSRTSVNNDTPQLVYGAWAMVGFIGSIGVEF